MYYKIILVMKRLSEMNSFEERTMYNSYLNGHRLFVIILGNKIRACFNFNKQDK